MTVSILIPYYNDREFLGQAIESVLNQTYKDFELILVNHDTKDDCREIAHSYKDPRIKHVDMDKNYGAGTGLIVHEFLKKATGEYVKLFCADDVMLPNCLEILVNYMENHPEKDFAFGNVNYIDENCKPLKRNWFKNRYQFSIDNTETDCLNLYFKGFSFLPYIGCILKRDIFNHIEIDTSTIMTFDMILWVSILLKGYKIGYINKIIANYRHHSLQMCSSKSEKKIVNRCYFEFTKYIETFFLIDNFSFLKAIFKDPRLDKFQDLSKDDIKFYLALRMLESQQHSFRITGYYHIFDCLKNPQRREHIKETFNFDIDTFRAIYSSGERDSAFQRAQELNISQLWYLFIKKVLFKLTLKDYFSKKRKKAL